MNWDTKRKLVYALAFSVTILAIAVFFMRGILFPEPTCFDTKHNGYETGVDCGGLCALMCSQEVNPLSVVWSKAVRSGPGVFDYVGMVKNTNIDNASREIGYKFIAYDDEGNQINELSGSTTPPLDGLFPIIVQSVQSSKIPGSVTLIINDGPHYKVLESPTSPTIRIMDRKYEPGLIPRVYATLMNTKRIEIRNLKVRVVLFDQNDNAYAVGETVIPEFSKEGIRDISFTWDEQLPGAPARIGIYPIFNPFEAIGY